MEPPRRQRRLIFVSIPVTLLLLAVVAGVVWRHVGGPTNQGRLPTMTTPGAKQGHPGAIAWSVVEPYWKAVDIYDGPRVFLNGFGKVPEHARHLLAVWWCDSEVCNGGFDQFFFNSTGVLAPEAVKGFRAIGLAECADLVEAASAKFGEPYPRDRAVRQTALETLQRAAQTGEVPGQFDELDKRYYAARDRLDFERTIDEYARRSAR